METELSFCELRKLEVINASDGRRLGHIMDMLFSSDNGSVRGIILPYGKRGFFQKSQDLFVPWKCVQKIGEDIILVEIEDLCSNTPTCVPKKKHEHHAEEANGEKSLCDGKCEKCMLFDCSRRWSGAL